MRENTDKWQEIRSEREGGERESKIDFSQK